MKSLLLGAVFGILALALPACAHEVDGKEGFKSLTVDEVAGLIAKKEADIFDNNSHKRWAESHVATAKWVQFDAVKASDLPADKLRKVVFYCANSH